MKKIVTRVVAGIFVAAILVYEVDSALLRDRIVTKQHPYMPCWYERKHAEKGIVI